jgi:hypothetical protein
MSQKLTDIFNNADKTSRSLAFRLQQVLDHLPAQLERMKQEYPGKDILLIQVPVDNGHDVTKPMDERRADIEAAAERTGRVLRVFEEKIIDAFPHINCVINGSNSLWGDHVFLNIVTSEESVIAQMRRAGIDPKSGMETIQGLQKIKSEKELGAYFSLHQSLDMVQGISVQVRAENGDANNMGPVTFTGWGPNPAQYHGRYLFWEVDAAWPKPALLPGFEGKVGPKAKQKPPQP